MSPIVLAVILAAGMPRPTLSGPEQIHLSADGLVRVHYTTEGGDALVVPDSVAWAEEGVARVVAVYVGEDGWPSPPSDEGRGGDDRLDVYFADLGSAYNGFTQEETLPSGHTASFIVLSPGRATLGQETFESIAGHELHHVLEMAVAPRGFEDWIAEMSATYAQYTVFNDGTTEFARNALWRERLTDPERPLDEAGKGDRWEYAGFIFVKYLVDRGGDRKIVKALWDAIAADDDALAAVAKVGADRLGLATLDDVLADYAAWNYYACSNDDGAHYDMTAGGCTYGGFVKAVGNSPPAMSTGDAIAPRGAAYAVVNPDCKTGDLTVNAAVTSGSARFQLVAGGEVAAKSDGSAMLVAPRWNRFSSVAVVATNTGTTPATWSVTTSVSGAYSGPPPTAITVTPAQTSLQVGDQTMLAASARYPSCSSNLDVTPRATWTSSNPRVATIGGTTLQALAPGTTEISAAVDGATSQRVTITVASGPGSSGCSLQIGPTIQSLPLLMIFFIAYLIVIVRLHYPT